MTPIDHPELPGLAPGDDMDAALDAHYARLERLAADELSEENRALAWATESDGRAWKNWWLALPTYKREAILVNYRFELAYARETGRPMKPFASTLVPDCVHAEEKALIERWAAEIKTCAIERRPVPFRESEDMSGLDRMTFRHRLAMAFTLAGVVIISEAPPEPKPKRKS